MDEIMENQLEKGKKDNSVGRFVVTDKNNNSSCMSSMVKHFQMMSVYNQRINEQLIHCCNSLSNEQLNEETHSFFPTIIAYWNHILFGDLILLFRLASNNIANLSVDDFSKLPTAKSPQDIYCHHFTDLVILRRKVDVLINTYCAHLTDEECSQSISYTTTEGQRITKPVAEVTQHLFNHQTHHRGQLTCLLSQRGIDYGCMDLPVIIATL
jgi:uncharacterized damage-inducible protein DinB